MPDASESEREAARENLRSLIEHLIAVEERLAAEERQERDSRNPDP
jgi:hypothetical protein